MANSDLKLINKSYNYAISQLFAPSLQQKIHSPSEEYNIKAFLESCHLYSAEDEWNLLKGLEVAYNYLKHNYRLLLSY